MLQEYRQKYAIKCTSIEDSLQSIVDICVFLRKNGVSYGEIDKKITEEILEIISDSFLSEETQTKLNYYLLQYINYYTKNILNSDTTQNEVKSQQNLTIPQSVIDQIDPVELDIKPEYDEDFLKIIGVTPENE